MKERIPTILFEKRLSRSRKATVLVPILSFVLALVFGGFILLVGFVDWLQTERWTNLSVLEFGYDTHLIRARWFINNRWSWWLHDLLHLIPLYAFLLALAPLSWVAGAWFNRR